MSAGKLIHVVDDDSGFLKGIQRLIRAHGLEVRAFASAEEFQAQADLAEAACLVLDINLGGITGIELLLLLHGAGVRVPAIVVTANGSEWTRRAAAAAGCCAYLEKPFSAHVLMGAIDAAMASSPVRAT